MSPCVVVGVYAYICINCHYQLGASRRVCLLQNTIPKILFVEMYVNVVFVKFFVQYINSCQRMALYKTNLLLLNIQHSMGTQTTIYLAQQTSRILRADQLKHNLFAQDGVQNCIMVSKSPQISKKTIFFGVLVDLFKKFSQTQSPSLTFTHTHTHMCTQV